jgi:hypothetical protein
VLSSSIILTILLVITALAIVLVLDIATYI